VRRLGISDRTPRRDAQRVARLAAIAIALSLGAGTAAQAADLLTGTSTSAGQVSMVDLANFGGFTFGFYHVQATGGCGGCMTYALPGGSPTAGGSFSVASSPFNFITDPAITNDPTANNQSAMPFGSSAPGVYVEHFGGFGTVILGTSVFTPGNLLTGGSNFEGFSVYAAPGSNTATFEFDLDQYATSSLLNLGSGPLYLDITGTTTSPVALTDLTPGQHPDFLTFTDPLTVDFTLTLRDTPFSPVPAAGGGGTGSGLPGVPEPMTWMLMLTGFGGVGLMLRRRRGQPGRRVAVEEPRRPLSVF
jgi:hypothetical protein